MRVVGIAGGSGSGKTTLAAALQEALGHGSAALLSHDAYYREREPHELQQADALDFDHPDALETDLLVRHLDALVAGRPAAVPLYDFSTHRRVGAIVVEPRPFVLVEGILLLTHAGLRERLGLSVFVDAPREVRLTRRLHRDVEERGRDRDEVLSRVARFVEPSHQHFVEPSSSHATLRVSGTEPLETSVARVLAQLMPNRPDSER